MAEFVPTYVIHNQFRAQSSHAQRSIAAKPFSAIEWVAGRRVISKRPIRLTEKEFKANEKEILAKVREGRLAVTCPDVSFIDSRPDGRLFTTHLNRPITEEDVASLVAPLKEWLNTHTNTSGEGPTAPPVKAVIAPEVITEETVVAPVVEEVTVKLEVSSDEVMAATSPDVDENSMLTLDQPRKKRRNKGEFNG
ncbi:hypothetical protein UFOVP276_53 [uncultured Caudovirales phage]|uniref:Uncharacterized protein n=1 Tax=uncultured Caudovirales phage TaxID=2100421 RepID=A0A6J5LN83_9CAUD|nr:hypothetical protein UFOVP127_190 [uncultured Caudovirales phage]CAB4135042.1 hypothetical protein UFOVP276_53 [uncultured Caudovirales phage]